MSFLKKFTRSSSTSNPSSSSKKEETPLFLVAPFSSATLVNGSFRKLVALPKYILLDEWLAANSKWRIIEASDFFQVWCLIRGESSI
jgi:hypothetical protein